MGDKLDELLEPGEAVVWRDSRPRAGLYVLLGAFSLLALAALIFIGVGNNLLLLFCGVVLCLGTAMGFVGAMLVFYDPIEETLVTNRRLLLRRRSREGDGIDTAALPLDRIAKIGLLENTYEMAVEVSTYDGGTERVGDLCDLDSFLAALGQQASLPGPVSIGRLARLSWFQVPLGLVLGLFFVSITMRLEAPPFDIVGFIVGFKPADILGFAVSGVLFIAVILFCAAGMLFGFCLSGHLISFVAILLMPRLAAAEEAENWLNTKPEGWLARWMLWKHPLYFKLASWRYGRPIVRHTAEIAGLHHG